MVFNNCVQGISIQQPDFSKSYWGYVADITTAAVKNISHPSILHIGLGANTISAAISKKNPDIHQTIVELDPVVIKACQEYFNLQDLTHSTIIQSDIFELLDKKPEWHCQFDTILTDIYTAHPDIHTPPENKYEFIIKISDWLKEDGILIFNRPAHTPALRLEAERLENYVKEEFEDVEKKYIKDPRGFENYIITATRKRHTKHPPQVPPR